MGNIFHTKEKNLLLIRTKKKRNKINKLKKFTLKKMGLLTGESTYL